MEEFVGQIWHKYINKAASREFPEAAVFFKDCRQSLAIQFRALGGELALELKLAHEDEWQGKRSWLSRLATNQEKQSLAYIDHNAVYLPQKLAIFPSKELNQKLYFWLVALLAHYRYKPKFNWMADNLIAVRATLNRFPGISKIYQKLSTEYIQLRNNFYNAEIPKDEKLLQKLILAPYQYTNSNIDLKKVYSVALWPNPFPKSPEASTNHTENQTDTTSRSQSSVAKSLDLNKKAKKTNDINAKDGLLAFRLESVFSWTEFVPVDRTADDDDQDDAAMAAEDADFLSVVRNDHSSKTRLKFGLDLPCEEQDDVTLANGILLPEWNYQQNRLIENHCSLNIMQTRQLKRHQFSFSLTQKAKKLRSQFESLVTQKQWLRSQPDGSEIDLEQYIINTADKLSGHSPVNDNLYIELRQNLRSLSCLLLADLSLSTESYVNNDHRVIDLIQDALFLFSESLSATQDRFAVSGFSSKNRDMVRYYPIKDFNESYNQNVKDKIASITPGYYTRMGAAIRFASLQLKNESSEKKLLLLISDGKPNDVDVYESRYGIEDTKHAVKEAIQQGIRVFCITVDDEESSYPSYIFGSSNYLRIKRTVELPEKLTKLYSLLTH